MEDTVSGNDLATASPPSAPPTPPALDATANTTAGVWTTVGNRKKTGKSIVDPGPSPSSNDIQNQDGDPKTGTHQQQRTSGRPNAGRPPSLFEAESATASNKRDLSRAGKRAGHHARKTPKNYTDLAKKTRATPSATGAATAATPAESESDNETETATFSFEQAKAASDDTTIIPRIDHRKVGKWERRTACESSLKRSSLEALFEPEGWASDVIIDRLLDSCSLERNHVSPCFADYENMNHPTLNNFEYEHLTAISQNRFVIIFNTNASHWTLVAFERGRKNHFAAFCSLNHDTPGEVTRALRIVKRFELSKNLPNTHWEPLHFGTRRGAVQTDGFSCGYFVSLVSRFWLERGSAAASQPYALDWAYGLRMDMTVREDIFNAINRPSDPGPVAGALAKQWDSSFNFQIKPTNKPAKDSAGLLGVQHRTHPGSSKWQTVEAVPGPPYPAASAKEWDMLALLELLGSITRALADKVASHQHNHNGNTQAPVVFAHCTITPSSGQWHTAQGKKAAADEFIHSYTTKLATQLHADLGSHGAPTRKDPSTWTFPHADGTTGVHLTVSWHTLRPPPSPPLSPFASTTTLDSPEAPTRTCNFEENARKFHNFLALDKKLGRGLRDAGPLGVKGPQRPTGKGMIEAVAAALKSIESLCGAKNHAEAQRGANADGYVLLTALSRLALRNDPEGCKSKFGRRQRLHLVARGEFDDLVALWNEAEMFYPLNSRRTPRTTRRGTKNSSRTKTPAAATHKQADFDPTNLPRMASDMRQGLPGRAARHLDPHKPASFDDPEVVRAMEALHPTNNDDQGLAQYRGVHVPITVADVRASAMKAKRGSAAGPNGLTPDFLNTLARTDAEDPIVQAAQIVHAAAVEARANGYINAEVLHLIVDANGFALDKPASESKPDAAQNRINIRPIACTDALCRESGATTQRALREKIEAALEGEQYAVHLKGGAEIAYTTITNLLPTSPALSLLMVDTEKAFQTMSRRLISFAIVLFLPELYNGFAMAYSNTSRVFYWTTDGLPHNGWQSVAPKCFLSASGVRQGDPLGPLYFSLGQMLLDRFVAAAITGRTIATVLLEDPKVCAEAKKNQTWCDAAFPHLPEETTSEIAKIMAPLSAATRRAMTSLVRVDVIFLDDAAHITMTSALIAFFHIKKAISESIAKQNFNLAKCVLYIQEGSDVTADAAAAQFPGRIIHPGTPEQERGFKYLGAPMGNPSFVKHFLETLLTRLEKLGRKLATVNNMQYRGLLLTYSFVHKARFILRVLDPKTTEQFAKSLQLFHLGLLEAATGLEGTFVARGSDSNGASQPDDPKETERDWLVTMAQLPFADGGFGIGDLGAIAPAAYLASHRLTASSGLLEKLPALAAVLNTDFLAADPDPASSHPLRGQLKNALAWLGGKPEMTELDKCTLADLAGHEFTQSSLTHAAYDYQRKSLIKTTKFFLDNPDSEDHERAAAGRTLQALMGATGGETSYWCRALPVDATSTFSDKQITNLAALRFGRPLPAAFNIHTCTKCGKNFEGGYHAPNCKKMGFQAGPHKIGVHTLVQAFKENTNLLVVESEPFIGPDQQLRADIKIFPVGTKGKTIMIDVTTANNHCITYNRPTPANAVVDPRSVPRRAAKSAEKNKHKQYSMCKVFLGTAGNGDGGIWWHDPECKKILDIIDSESKHRHSESSSKWIRAHIKRTYCLRHRRAIIDSFIKCCEQQRHLHPLPFDNTFFHDLHGVESRGASVSAGRFSTRSS